MLDKGVSNNLYNAIRQTMKIDSLNDFYLGGGTNLAIRYNHRLSTDIDLFSSKVVGIDVLKNIVLEFKEKYGEENVKAKVNNSTSENLAWLQIIIIENKEPIKVEIIQNIQLLYPIEMINGIRMIDEKDIGALKLLSVANRGVQKDFYDLELLTNKYPLSDLYADLLKRDNDNREKNIFDIEETKPITSLKTSLSSLIDFSKGGDVLAP